MVAQYAELDLIWQKVRDDTTGGVADEFKEGIRENQLMLLVRIRRLAGDRTRDLIRKAVKETRRTRLPKKSTRDLKPREAPDAESAAVTVSTSTSSPSPETIESQSVEEEEPYSPFSPNADRSLPSNRQIIHELSLDSEFRLSPPRQSALESLITATAKRAFWDSLRLSISRGDITTWIPSLASTVRTRLLRLLDPKGALYRNVSDSIDLQLIYQQCEHGGYDYEKLISYVLDLLPQICSPARDEDVAKLRALPRDDFTIRLQKLLDVLELMQLDHANFLLMLAAPKVIPDAVAYEQRLFAADLAANRISLANTTRWLRAAKAQLPPGTPARKVHVHAFLNLVFAFPSPSPSDQTQPEKYPELLHLDHDRIQIMQTELKTFILAAAITITVKTLLRRDVRTSWRELASYISGLLSPPAPPADTAFPPEITESAQPPSIDEIAATTRAFVASSQAVRDGILTSVEAAVKRVLERGTDDPVVRVVQKRIREFLEVRVGDIGSRERVRLEAEVGEVLGAWGMGEFVGEAQGVKAKLGRWEEVTWGWGGEWVRSILAEER